VTGDLGPCEAGDLYEDIVSLATASPALDL